MIESSDKLHVDAAATFWNSASYLKLAELKTGLASIGFEKFAPSARTPSAALRDALEEVFPSKNHKVEKTLEPNSFEVIHVERGAKKNRYNHIATVGIDTGAQVELVPFEQALAERIVWAFNKHLGLVTAPAVTATLTSLIESFHGQALRKKGGLYWLPMKALADWRRIAEVVEAVPSFGGKTAVYLINHSLGSDEVRAVRDAIVREVDEESARIHQEVMSGDLGDRALETRLAQAEDLRKKITLYEELLHVGLGDLRETLEQAEEACCAAKLLVSAGASQPQAAGV